MSADPTPINLETDDAEIELVNIDDLPEAEWDDELRASVAYLDAHPGCGIPHQQVAEWLSRVGTPEETAMPDAWLPK